MKFKKKPVVIEAITFDELIAHGVSSGARLVNGMPWSFDYQGQPITHETDDCYLIPTLEGTMRFERGDMLITGVKGEIYPCKADIFEMTYEPCPDHLECRHTEDPIEKLRKIARKLREEAEYMMGAPESAEMARVCEGVIEEVRGTLAEMERGLRLADIHIGWGDCTLENVHNEIRELLSKLERSR